jgi:CRP-like cAMP-binding protein
MIVQNKISGVKDYEKNQVIFDKFNYARYVYFIISGSVEVFFTYDNGSKKSHGIFMENDILGEFELYNDNAIYVLKAKALKETKVIRILKKDFEQLLEQIPKLYKPFIILLLKKVQKNLYDVHTHANPSRKKDDIKVARVLVKLTKEKGKKDKNGWYIFYSVSLKDISDYCSIQLSQTSRVVSTLKKKGIVQTINENGNKVTAIKVNLNELIELYNINSNYI